MSKIIAIAGMHRSGTSLTANWLHNCGLFLGDRLMSGGFGNPKGHYEDWEVVRIHEADFKKKKLHTSGLRIKKKEKFSFEESTKRAIEELAEKRNNYDVWGWKEPRGTLYLHEWKRKLSETKCIAMYRDYNEVIDSLKRRLYKSYFKSNKFKPLNRFMHILAYPIYERYEISCFTDAWIKYNRSILDFKAKYPKDCIIINMKSIISENRKVFDLLNGTFNLNLEYSDINDIFEKKMLNTNPKKNFLPRKTKLKAEKILYELNAKSEL